MVPIKVPTMREIHKMASPRIRSAPFLPFPLLPLSQMNTGSTHANYTPYTMQNRTTAQCSGHAQMAFQIFKEKDKNRNVFEFLAGIHHCQVKFDIGV